MSFKTAVDSKAIELNHLVLDMCSEAGSGHPTSALSLGHIVTTLLYHSMRWLPDHPRYPTSDRLVLSEGHAVPIVYAAYADLEGVVGREGEHKNLNTNDLSTLREASSLLDGHPNPMEGFPFFDAATGSLGQGLSVAAGLGLAAAGDGLDKKIYCLIGDGESREGQIWEALDFIIDHNLTNVLPIFNCNGYGQADAVSDQQSAETMQKKLEAFGWDAIILDGHDADQIRDAIEKFRDQSADAAPVAVVAQTIKGWGIPSIQGQGWHGKPASGEALAQAHEELNATAHELATSDAMDELRIYPPTEWSESATPEKEAMTLDQAFAAFDMQTIKRGGRLATRKAYGLALRCLGQVNPNVFALDADVSNSTFANGFADDQALSSRFVECKIAEQNMISVGAGLSAAGKIPFCSTFAKFLTRAYDQIEMGLYSGAQLKIVGSHAGISLAADGPSQMSLPDIAWFRSLSRAKNHQGNPGCYVLQPADAYAAYALTMAMADYDGLCYMRTHRPDVEFIYDENTEFDLGGFEVLTHGRDLLIASAGYMVHECNKAIDRLDKLGIDATLVDMYSLPFDEESLLDLANDNGGMVLTVEDNFGASLGSAIADACTESGDAFTIQQMYVKRIPKSARNEDAILGLCGLDAVQIAQSAASMLGVVAS